jgi:hypothetical protein
VGVNMENALATVNAGVKNHSIPRTQLFYIGNLNG